MCRLRNIAMRDYQESVTSGQTDRQTPDKIIPMCHYALQATQKQGMTDRQTHTWMERHDTEHLCSEECM